jgi:hypothetical protein
MRAADPTTQRITLFSALDIRASSLPFVASAKLFINTKF